MSGNDRKKLSGAMAVDAFAALFFGWLLGALYDIRPSLLVIVSVTAQILAALCYALCIRRQSSET